MEFLKEQREVQESHLRKIREGSVCIFVPDPQYYQESKSEYVPASLPVFYNPQMELNRDISVLTLKTYKEVFQPKRTLYIEGLGASGIRGFRINNAIRGEIKVILNDINPQAASLMKYNRKYLGKSSEEIEIFNSDINFLFQKLINNGMKANVIEIDPFGSPSPFLHSAVDALRSKSSILLITATDLTVLHGKYPNVALRKYGSKIIETPFSKELSIRALLYTLTRVASIFRRSIKPLFGFFFNNFAKIGVLVNKSKKKANKIWENIGWMIFCPVCKAFWIKKGITSSIPEELMREHEKIKVAGPLWVEPIWNPCFCKSMLSSLEKNSIKTQNSWVLRKAIEKGLVGRNIPLYYNITTLAQMLSRPSPSIDEVVENINSKGYNAYRTHFNSTGVKTDANIKIVKRIIKEVTST